MPHRADPVRRLVRRLVPLALVLGLAAAPASADVVISQVYGGGGNAGATYTNDFIELFNNGASSVDLTGWSVQYASTSGTSWQVTNLSGSIAAGQYYLVQQAAGTGGTTPLPTPDATGSIAMAAANGKVALVDATTALSGSCPTAVDFVGFGTANCYEGTGATPALSNTTAAIRGSAGCDDTNDNSADFTAAAPTPRNSASPTNVCGGGGGTTLSVSDVAVTEGDSGTVDAIFTISLTAAAPAGGVTFDAATADGTATLADNDYVQVSLTGQSIAEGNTSTTVTVTVNGDTDSEPNEQFFLNVTNVVGTDVTVADGQGVGTINNDDVTLTPISSVQGSSGTSPLVGNTVTVEGIVTALRSGSFFVQTDGDPVTGGDNDPATSEGILVFKTPTGLALGDKVQVTGTVVEFVPSADPSSPSITEFGSSASFVVISSGNTLPDPVEITGAMTTDTTNGMNVLEHLEGMRVSVPSMTVVAPTMGSVSETSNTSTSNGIFFGVVTGVARPFREPGVASLNTLPAGAPGNVPRFDENPERLRVDSDAQTGAAKLDANSGDLVTGTVGVLDYGFRTYTIYPDPGTATHVPVRTDVVAVSTPTSAQITIASFNVQRLFDSLADGVGPTVNATTYQKRLQGMALAIRDVLKSPDVIGLQEVEKIGVLEDLAAELGATGGAYTGYLVEGNDPGGIDNGFLVKDTVNVVSVNQELAAETYVDPQTNTTDLLHDRPPLVLDATFPAFDNYRIVVIDNHHRSLNGIESTSTSGSTTGATEGERVREKRRRQAESLATYVQGLQAADPTLRIVLVGDFNAFQFSDGLVDVIGTIKGTPAPADEVVVASADLVNPDLTNLVDAKAATERYSYLFDGNAQTLDHVLVSQTVLGMSPVLEHARLNADFFEAERNDKSHLSSDPVTPERSSDHDPAVLFLTPESGVLGVTVSIGDATVVEGNATPNTAEFTVSLSEASTVNVTVSYGTTNGTASSGSDYTAASGSLVFTPGQTSKTVSVATVADTTGEADETFQVVLSDPMNATIADDTGTGMIVDDDLPSDWNGDGQRDLVFRNHATGANAIWLLNGTTRVGAVVLPSAPDLDYRIVAQGDFNGDGQVDLVWRNQRTGANAVWFMSNTTRTGIAGLPSAGDTNWRIVGSGDFDDDGQPDLLWRNYATGANAVWFMNGTLTKGIAALDTAPDLKWSIAGADDFNGDGKPDILWRNYTTGANAVWFMDGTSRTGAAGLDPAPDVNWRIVGTGGAIVWRNQATGANAIWYMNGVTRVGIAGLDPAPDVSWRIVPSDF